VSDMCDALITEVPTSFTAADVHAFVGEWAPRTRGWMIAVTANHELFLPWQAAYRAAGRYAFSPVVIILGFPQELPANPNNDGPAPGWASYAMTARPRTKEFARWGTLPGAYWRSHSCDESKHRGRYILSPLWRLIEHYSRPGDVVLDAFGDLAGLRSGHQSPGREIIAPCGRSCDAKEGQ
jgi:hypothetical protein